jgi:hypothetical protein
MESGTWKEGSEGDEGTRRSADSRERKRDKALRTEERRTVRRR